MKLLFITFFYCLKSYAQTSEAFVIEHLNELLKAKIQWSSVSRNTFTKEEKQSVTTILRDSSNVFCNDFQIEGNYYEDFHLIDLDGDSDQDLIFEGIECGSESKTVLVYLKNKGLL